MSEQDVHQSVQDLLHVLTVPSELAYIYRGESRADYGEVSSNLYREYKDTVTISHISIGQIEFFELEAAAKHDASNMDDARLRSLVQHYHGKTNAIDFTGDINVALFFACDGDFDKDGRVIRLDPQSTVCEITEPAEPQHRIIVQKSIFVTPPNGYVPSGEYQDATVIVPAKLKLPILAYLRRYHGISSRTIYNDLHGFVHYRANHKATIEMNFSAINRDASGEYQEAIELLNESIARDPDASVTHLLKGMVNQGAGHIPEAIENFNAAIALNPNNANAYNYRGICHYWQGDNDQARADYSETLAINPNHSSALTNRGLLRHENGNRRGAMRDYDRALRIDSTLVIALNNRGLLHLASDDPDAAIADLDAAIRLQPRWALPYLNRGYAYHAKGDAEQGDADIRRAIALEPGIEL